MSDPVPAPAAGGEEAPEDQIGVRIAERRLAKGLTHDGLAKLTKLLDRPTQSGISRTTIRGYEVGLYKPGTRELRLLSQALEVSPTWLIFGGTLDASAGVIGAGAEASLPQTELQKFIVALTLLRAIEPGDRQVVYDVLHALARHKCGETAYRAAVITYREMGALLGDYWADLKEHRQVDQAKMQQLAEAYKPHIDAILERELGMKLSDLQPKE
jgi:transcriptional regulator with XRE-family HTH domain